MVRFGHLVMGPPGSGKTTYCRAMSDFLRSKGRKSQILSLDPANEFIPMEVAADISQLVKLEDVMEMQGLGPNGGLLAAMDYLASNLDWLRGRIEGMSPESLLLFDLPGQVELLNNSQALPTIIRFLTKEMDVRLVAVHLVDSLYATEPTKFISVLLSSLCSMVKLELPHVNVLSKMGLQRELPIPLESLSSELDVDYILALVPDDPFLRRHAALTTAIGEVVRDYGLLRFIPLDVEEESSMEALLAEADRANGFCYGPDPLTAQQLFSTAMPPDQFHNVNAAFQK